MPTMINQPSNQIKLTNVSIVRLKKGKKRFEIACYKNKVLEYRSGQETNLDEVLQIPNVFLNVSKGQTAPSDDLKKAFGPDKSVDAIVLEILQKGEIQVGEKERSEQLARLQAEVVDIVAGKLVDPESKRVYTPGLITKALDQLSSQSARERQEEVDKEKHRKKEAEDAEELKKEKKPMWNGVTTSKSAKMLALEAMKALIAWQPLPVARARMRLRVICDVTILKQSVRLGSKPGSKEQENSTDGGGKKKASKKSSKKSGTTEAPVQPKLADSEEDSEQKIPGTVKDKILSYIEEVQDQDEVGGEWEVTGFVEPGAFKHLSEFIDKETKRKGRYEVLDPAVIHEDV